MSLVDRHTLGAWSVVQLSGSLKAQEVRSVVKMWESTGNIGFNFT